jgi:hypothetical protein
MDGGEWYGSSRDDADRLCALGRGLTPPQRCLSAGCADTVRLQIPSARRYDEIASNLCLEVPDVTT